MVLVLIKLVNQFGLPIVWQIINTTKKKLKLLSKCNPRGDILS